ncbi:ribonuclease H-like domain-containing protein, partial [Amylostereum chailletii]
IYTDGSCLDNGKPHARAGAGVYQGENSSRNLVLRVPDEQTNNRGECLAILVALAKASPDRPLRIYSDSEYAIRSVTWWAPKSESLGWQCANGDLLKDCVAWMKARSAAVYLEHITAHSGNWGGDAADRLAKLGTAEAAAGPYMHLRIQPTDAHQKLEGPTLNVPKVTTNLP